MQDRVGLEAPGQSLFEGTDSIHINAGMHRQEEEEQEDRKRRHVEIKELLTDAFYDLSVDDDASSRNSSHIHDASRETDHSEIVNCSVRSVINENGPTFSQYQNDFGMYTSDGTVNNKRNTPYVQQLNDTTGPNIPHIAKEFGEYGVLGTPINNNKGNNSPNSITESPYELPRPPSLTNPTLFPQDLRAQINDGYTLIDNYPGTYSTPSNHYDAVNSKNFPNNGYVESYDDNAPYQGLKTFGGGDSDINSDHYNHCYKTSPNGRPDNDAQAYKATDFNGKEQLAVLYEVRMREIKQLTEQLKLIEMEKEEAQNESLRKIQLLQAELEQSNSSKTEKHDALVDAKAQIIELQSQATCYEEKIAVMEKTNENLMAKLSVAKESIIDLQQKICVLERVQSLHANDKTHEKFLKQAQEKHAIEIKNMQIQIDTLTEKLNEKESAYVTLEHKLTDLRRAHEILIVEKGDAMNHLAQALEDSQEQCRHLMATNNTQELIQLQDRIKSLNNEKSMLLEEVRELQRKLDVVKADTIQFDSLLATTLEDETDSIRQLKLGESNGKSRNPEMHIELQRCLNSQALKRRKISQLEDTLVQKEKELKKAHTVAETSQQEAMQYAKRVGELEKQIKTLISDYSVETNTEIQRLSDQLAKIMKQNDSLIRENQKLEQSLKSTLANQEETTRKIEERIMEEQQNILVDEYNKEYLEIHEKAIERVRQGTQEEIVQLTVQLEQTQKELDRVKELYIDVCGTKDQLINEHKNEIKMLKETYSNLENQKHDMDELKMELELQKIKSSKITHEYESLMKKNVELEKDLNNEKKKRTEYMRKVHEEIARAKEEALVEIRNACPEHQIKIPLSDHCSEHSDKIAQLEDDCKRLEEKLSTAVEEQQRMADLQTEVDDTRIKMAQMEIALVSMRKTYNSTVSERNELISKLAKQESIIANMKKSTELQVTDESSLSAKFKIENDSLKEKCDSLLKDKIKYETKISELETQLAECRREIAEYLENKVSPNNNSLSTTQNSLEKQLNDYKELVKSLTAQLNSSKDHRKSEYFQEEKWKQLELELAEKEAQLQRLKDLEKIKDERDQLVAKLKNQAKQFEQYVRSQKQVSAELNLSPRNMIEGVDFQKIREMSRIEVRDEMEQKLTKELRIIEEQHREKGKFIEENYKRIIRELNSRYAEKTKELQTSFKAQEQIVTHMIEAKLSEYRQELLARKLKIDALEAQLEQKERDVEEKKNVMAQAMSKWAVEMQDMEANQMKMQKEIIQFQEMEEVFKKEICLLKDRVNTFKHKYQSAKKTSQNYKELAEKKEKFLMSECRRIIEGYNKVMNQVQQNFDDIVSTQEKQVDEKFKEFQNQYDEKLHQVRLQMKYKDKS